MKLKRTKSKHYVLTAIASLVGVVSLWGAVANSSGPYTVVVDGSLPLDGSASQPSDGETITSYEWDLNNDNTFGDVTGVTPATISFSDLQSVHGMALGANTIQLRVTDSSLLSSTVSITVNLVLAVPTPGFDFLCDASQDDGSNNRWEDLVAGNPSGLELLLDDSPAVSRVPISVSNTFFSYAYDFPESSVNEGGALLVTTGTATAKSFDHATGDWSNNNVTMEIWFKPDNIDSIHLNGQILFETGGFAGLGFFVANNELHFRKSDGNGLVAYNLATDPSDLLATGHRATDEFIQAVGIFNVSAGSMQLFVNGVSVGTDTPGGSDWSGDSAAAFGTLADTYTGGLGPGAQNTESYDGQIALVRIYHDQILTPAQVEDNFNALSGPDVTAPQITALSPLNNATGLYPEIGTLVATFNEDVALSGAGSITIKNLDDGTGSSDVTIPLPSGSVTLNDRELSITLGSALALDTNFAVRISHDALLDLEENSFAGIGDDTTWSFSTAIQNLNPPVIIVKSPDDGVSGVAIVTNIVATFDQNIVLGTGNIVIKDLMDDSTTLSIPVTDPLQVSVSDNVLTINPASVLVNARRYAVQIPSTAVRNFSDINFAGITNETNWDLATVSIAGQLGILDLTANGGINQATGNPWKLGDRYRLAFITSTDSFPASSNITTYNAEVQALANASSLNLSPATWNVIGSTTTVDARDNTSTNPFVNGTGHAIFNLDGATVVANNYADLWDGTVLNPINIMETGQLFNRIPWPYTGTRTDGTKRTGTSVANADRTPFGGSHIGQGTLNNNSHWVWRDNTGSTVMLPYYALSNPLFIVDFLDATVPTFVSIGDNVSEGPVDVDATVVFTVTFNEAMLPSTVDASDFENAGTSKITINSIHQLDDPEVFEVTLTPITPGTLQLQIAAAKELTDLNGNPLDTTSPLPDDTIINVQAVVPYDIWAGGAIFTDDDNGDGVKNGLAWILGAANPSVSALDKLPTMGTLPGYLTLDFTRENPYSPAKLYVEYGSDLAGWTKLQIRDDSGTISGSDVEVVVTPGSPTPDTVTVKIPTTHASSGKLFGRLSATKN